MKPGRRGNGPPPSADIDERLRRLLAETPRGVELSHREIAAACGCSWQLIWLVEQRAMKKLRQELVRPGVREALLLT